jgi:hypothetical protein
MLRMTNDRSACSSSDSVTLIYSTLMPPGATGSTRSAQDDDPRSPTASAEYDSRSNCESHWQPENFTDWTTERGTASATQS